MTPLQERQQREITALTNALEDLWNSQPNSCITEIENKEWYLEWVINDPEGYFKYVDNLEGEGE